MNGHGTRHDPPSPSPRLLVQVRHQLSPGDLLLRHLRGTRTGHQRIYPAGRERIPAAPAAAAAFEQGSSFHITFTGKGRPQTVCFVPYYQCLNRMNRVRALESSAPLKVELVPETKREH